MSPNQLPADAGGGGARPARGYAGWLAAAFAAVLVASLIALYLLYDGAPNAATEDVYGRPQLPQALATPPIRPASPAPLATAEPAAALAALTSHASSADHAPAPGDEGSADSPARLDTTVPADSPAGVAAAPADTLLDRARALAGRELWADALRAYARLVRERPHDRALALERARVLAWSGEPAAAAVALVPLIAASSEPAALRFERARYLWWAGLGDDAEAALTELFAAGAADAAALELRQAVRASLSPSSATARQWLAEHDSPAGHLRLARALAAEGDAAAAIAPLRRAIDAGLEPRDLLLEFAAVAVTADSAAIAANALERWLRENDATDAAVRLRLARAYAWSGSVARAIALFDELIAASPSPVLLHERARLHVARGELDRAESDLLAFLAAEPRDAEALALLAELRGWRGPVALAAAEPAGTASPAAPAPAPAAPAAAAAAWRLETESFLDSESFRWHAVQAHRRWALGGGGAAAGVTVRHDQTRGAAGGVTSDAVAGFGVVADGALPLSGGVTALGGLGLRYFSTIGALPQWLVGLELRDGSGGWLLICYEREPAVRRASTAAALEASVLSDRLRANAETAFGAYAVAAGVEAELLHSGLGDSRRLAGSVWLGRPIGHGFGASIGVGGVTTGGDVPVLAGWGPLYWMPRYYVAPALSLRYETSLGERWSAGARVAPTWVFVAERDGAEPRFPARSFASGSAGVDIGYAHPAFDIGLSADWSGALENGYRAGALRLRITPRGSR